mmetsp:Transcript_62371/g.193316  ORF Transcript_62371/g.193316 Transcript_62371/m.193316 type:complete len:320 (-) Transcript_62371:341-1300(-)
MVLLADPEPRTATAVSGGDEAPAVLSQGVVQIRRLPERPHGAVEVPQVLHDGLGQGDAALQGPRARAKLRVPQGLAVLRRPPCQRRSRPLARPVGVRGDQLQLALHLARIGLHAPDSAIHPVLFGRRCWRPGDAQSPDVAVEHRQNPALLPRREVAALLVVTKLPPVRVRLVDRRHRVEDEGPSAQQRGVRGESLHHDSEVSGEGVVLVPLQIGPASRCAGGAPAYCHPCRWRVREGVHHAHAPLQRAGQDGPLAGVGRPVPALIRGLVALHRAPVLHEVQVPGVLAAADVVPGLGQAQALRQRAATVHGTVHTLCGEV